MGNGTVTYTEGTGAAARSDKYYNFALVYTDGEVSGKVNNLSGSNASIDIIISTPNPLDDDEKVETVGATSGNFELGGLIEALGYTAEIEDAGFSPPCIGADGMPDDNFEQADGTCNDGTNATERFATTLMADIEGENDHEGLGTLTVYNSRLEAADELATLSVKAVTSPVEDADTLVELSTFDATGVTQDASGTNDVASSVESGTAIIWAKRNVTVVATVSTDASYTVKLGTGLPVVPHATRGATVTLPYYATDAAPVAGTPVAGTARESTITVEVTAENGYNDHTYTFTLSAAAPVGYALAAADITGADGTEDGTTIQNAWTATTASATATTTTITVDLDEITGTTDCGQTLVVKDGDDVVDRDEDSTACAPQYDLTAEAGGNLHTLEVTSQDGKKEVYYLWVNLGT